MAKPLTPRQQEVLNFIHAYWDENGYAPTLEEIRAHLGLGSLATVHKHVSTLEAKGALRRENNRNRSMEVIDSNPFEVPLLGRIAAGMPIEAIPTRDTIGIPPQLASGAGTYVLRVSGESMIDEHIADGDFVIVEKRQTANSGDLVVALVDNENATLKRIYFDGAYVRLEPSNKTMRAVTVEAERVTIQGIIIGLMREYN